MKVQRGERPSVTIPWFGVSVICICLSLILAACSTTDRDVATTASSQSQPSDASRVEDSEAGDSGDLNAQAVADADSKEAEPIAKYVGHESSIYSNPDRWLCLPDRQDTCSEGLLGAGFDVTTVGPDDTITTKQVTVDASAAFDCFYVYPTVSGDETPISDFEPAVNQEITAVFSQAAGLGSTCRVIAPIYRQATLANLGSGASELASPHEGEGKFNDVLDAWSYYMAHINNGRGVVLIGHSQGSLMILELLKSEFDGPENAEMRERLIAAYLAGWAIQVPQGEVVGGDLSNIPACTENGQIGCVVSWSSYGASEPPGPAGIFGRSDGTGNVAICHHPGDLSLGVTSDEHETEPRPLQSRFLVATANDAGDGVVIASDRWLDPAIGTLTTPFIEVPGMFSAHCVERDGLRYLEVRQHDNPTSARQVNIAQGRGPTWGLHIMDVSLVFGDMVEQITQQGKTYSQE